jgi:hypothetical protein
MKKWLVLAIVLLPQTARATCMYTDIREQYQCESQEQRQMDLEIKQGELERKMRDLESLENREMYDSSGYRIQR